MASFFLIVCIIVVAFTYSFALLEYNDDDALRINFPELYKSFIVQFNVMYGDFSELNDENFGIPEFILFFSVTLFVPLVMLNLLIAVISET